MNKVVCVNDVSVGELIDVLNSDKNIVVDFKGEIIPLSTQYYIEDSIWFSFADKEFCNESNVLNKKNFLDSVEHECWDDCWRESIYHAPYDLVTSCDFKVCVGSELEDNNYYDVIKVKNNMDQIVLVLEQEVSVMNDYKGYIVADNIYYWFDKFTDLVNFNECVNGGEYMTIWDVKHEDKEIESIIRREIDDKNNSLSANELMWSIGYIFDLTDRNEEVFIKLLKKYTLNECFNLDVSDIIRQYQAECS